MLAEISSIISSFKDRLDSWIDSLISYRIDSLILPDELAMDSLMDSRMDSLMMLESPAIDSLMLESPIIDYFMTDSYAPDSF